MEFTSEIDEYVVLKLYLDSYKRSLRELESGYRIAGYESREIIRKKEKQLLKMYFKNWKAPYNGALAGWRIDSPCYILKKEELVAGIYLCDKNEFNEGNGKWGQLHYVFVDPNYRGKGIHSILFREAIDIARKWDLQGLILNSDRYNLPEVYIRWGAVPWKKIEKNTPQKGSTIPLFGLFRDIFKKF